MTCRPHNLDNGTPYTSLYCLDCGAHWEDRSCCPGLPDPRTEREAAAARVATKRAIRTDSPPPVNSTIPDDMYTVIRHLREAQMAAQRLADHQCILPDGDCNIHENRDAYLEAVLAIGNCINDIADAS